MKALARGRQNNPDEALFSYCRARLRAALFGFEFVNEKHT
jgi:hypothetical protein